MCSKRIVSLCLTHFCVLFFSCWFLTQMVSLANEVHGFHVSKNPTSGALTREPSLYDILSYSYCYVGIMTGKAVDMNNVGLNLKEKVIFCVLTLNNFVYVAINVSFSFA